LALKNDMNIVYHPDIVYKRFICDRKSASSTKKSRRLNGNRKKCTCRKI